MTNKEKAIKKILKHHEINDFKEIKIDNEIIRLIIELSQKEISMKPQSDNDVLRQIQSQLFEMNNNIVEIKSDIVELKNNIIEIKSDIVKLKNNVVEIKSDIVELKNDVTMIKSLPTIQKELAASK